MRGEWEEVRMRPVRYKWSAVVQLAIPMVERFNTVFKRSQDGSNVDAIGVSDDRASPQPDQVG